jgi:hypothetical protein
MTTSHLEAKWEEYVRTYPAGKTWVLEEWNTARALFFAGGAAIYSVVNAADSPEEFEEIMLALQTEFEVYLLIEKPE